MATGNTKLHSHSPDYVAAGGRHKFCEDRRSSETDISGAFVPLQSHLFFLPRRPHSSDRHRELQASNRLQHIMKICGTCERQLPDDSHSEEQRGRRQSSRRCMQCVAAGKELVLMKKGRKRSEDDDCPICQLPLPLDVDQSSFRLCCMKVVCKGCILAARKRGMWDCPFCRAPTPHESQSLAMIRKRVDAGDPAAICHLGTQYRLGRYGLEKDVARAVELYERAAVLGVKEAH